MDEGDKLLEALEVLREIERKLANGDLMPEDGGEVEDATWAATLVVGNLENLLSYLGIDY
jgi:hypothetical protein